MKKLYIRPFVTTYKVSTQRLMQLSETQRGGRGNETITIGYKDEEIGARDFGGHSLWED